MRRIGAALVLVLALVMTSCSAIPSNGPVHTAPPQNADLPGTVQFTPEKPLAGAQRADIVRGFLYAATGYQNDYRIARDYLTPAFATRWNPSAGITVSTGAVRVSSDGSSASVPVAAHIDEDGLYREAAAGSAPVPLTFTLVRVNGEWRISHANDGIVLQSSIFEQLFGPFALQYFTPSFLALTPDVRWFPSHGLTATSVVRRLLGGAAGPVAAPVTASAFPVGTRLIGSVVRAGPTALVDLHFPGGAPDTATLGRARRQLEQTLKGLGVDRVSLAVDRQRQATVQPSPLKAVVLQDAPLVLRGGKFGYLSVKTQRLAEDAVLGAAIVKADPVAVTASDSQAKAAVLTRSGAVLVRPSHSPLVVDPRPDLVAPTLDSDGWLWSTTTDGDDFRVGDGVHSRSVTFSPNLTSVVGIEASADGTRMLVAGSDGTRGPRVVVVGIERSSTGTPLALTSAEYDLTPSDPGILGATWADTGTIGVLTRTSAGGDDVTLWQLGNTSTDGGEPSGATRITGGGSQEDLTVFAAHTLQQAQGDSIWQTVASGVALLAVQR